MPKFVVPIRGMHCRSCEIVIEENIREVPGVQRVDVSHRQGVARVWFAGTMPSKHKIQDAVEAAGYKVGQKERLPWISRNFEDYKHLLNVAVILLFLFLVARWSGLMDANVIFSQKTVAMAAVIGLVAGVSSCMALIGGLVLGLSARHAELHPEAGAMQKFRPHLFFNLGRVLGFAVLGGLIGLLGSALQPSPPVLAVLTLFVGLVMVVLGLKLIEIFPALRDKSITLPKFVSRMFGLRQETKEYSHRGALMAGALSFFLPCGFTQAMQLYAVSTGSFTQGALIMSLFALGTAPGLLGIGGLSSVFKGAKARVFFAMAGLAVIFMGIFNITNASRIVLPLRGASEEMDIGSQTNIQLGQFQLLKADYAIDPGLQPKQFTVKAGLPVRMEINVLEEDYGCMGSIMIPGLYQKPQFMYVGQTVLEFTPKKAGSYRIICAMGIPHGTLIVN